MQQCAQCESRRLEQTREDVHMEVDGHTFTAALPALRCLDCDETYIAGPEMGRFELRVAAILARSGMQSGGAFRFMRKAVGLRASDLAELLDVTQETISRWETGKRAVDRSALATLGALVLDKLADRQETLERLRALREPKPVAKRVRLGDGEAA